MEELAWSGGRVTVYLNFVLCFCESEFRPVGPWGSSSVWGANCTERTGCVKHYGVFGKARVAKDMSIMGGFRRRFGNVVWELENSR